MTKQAILFFTAINFLNYFDRYLVAALLPVLRAEMHLDYEQGARLVSAFVFGYFLFSPVFGVLGDRYNRPRLMAIGVGLWSVATIFTGFAWSFLSFIVIRIFVGIGEASFGTISPGFIKDRESNPVQLNKTLSIFFTAIPVGSALAYVFAGQIERLFSWKYVFLFGGVPGLILAPFLLRFDDQRSAAVQSTPIKEGLRAISKVPLLLMAIGGYMMNSFALSGIAAHISDYGKTIGFTLDEITLRFGLILVISGFLGTIAGGRICSALAEKSDRPLAVMMKFIGFTSMLAVPLLALTFIVQSHWVFLILCFVVETLVFAGTAPVNSVIVSSSPPGMVALSQGVTIFMLNLVGALLSPLIIGVFADATSLAQAMQLTTIALLCCSIFWVIGARFAVVRASQ